MRNFLLLFLFSAFLGSCVSEFSQQQATFAGSHTCIECHENEYRLWKGSDHDNAMDTAIASTVLGDFDNAEFEWNGFVNRFYTREGKYFVHTQGTGGKAGDFQIAYTFGVRPLQQYLIPFEKGRLQCLQIAWDTERKRWYHLADSVYGGEAFQPDDWLYWTNNGQNWNGMCAECHSTNLQKNFDPQTHVYQTTWSEIDVGCEACHGPGSAHNQWATLPEKMRLSANNLGLVVQTSNISSRQFVDQCAYCHARRSSFGDFVHPRDNVYDILSPQLPIEPYYYPDGQILEEDYVYASFTQSKMHQNKVRCSNCHDVHSLKLKKQGNDLCMQCHKAVKYNTYDHHFHKDFNEQGAPLILEGGNKTVEVGEGAQCVNCHMPGAYFMGVDYRRDHSMRIPRPDLSDELGTPNACNQCHTDKSNRWAASFTGKWYEGAHHRPHFGKAMFLAEREDTAAVSGLFEIVESKLSTPLIKAAATSYLSLLPQGRAQETTREMLKDPEAVVRREAVRGLRPKDLADLIQSLVPLLNDPTKMVRIETVAQLSAVPLNEFDTMQKRAFHAALSEYIETMEYSADFTASRHNLGNLYTNLGQFEKAEANYLEAIRIDEQFFPAIINLAMLYNRMNQNGKAEILLKHLVEKHPAFDEAYYSLGLLLGEMQKYDEAIVFLEQAAERMPARPRIFFNLYQLQLYKDQVDKAETSLQQCLELEPGNLDYCYAAIEFYLKLEQTDKAKEYARQALCYHPGLADKAELEQFIQSMP
ncbi:MAG: tetratricopeptide repeat protein [Bacteroidales bacterium]|nr:tetratricopeptide repeat protein [Bacteroidales bacterium]